VVFDRAGVALKITICNMRLSGGALLEALVMIRLVDLHHVAASFDEVVGKGSCG
jgi:hypothetical protein